MYNGLKLTLAFALGAAAGSVVTWRLLKTTYERIAQEEIDSVKEVFSRRAAEADQEAVEKEAYTVIANVYNTIGKEKNEEEKGGSEEMAIDKPYVIAPEEFDELDGYETRTLVYYEDEVLADDTGDIVDDIDEIVGEDSLTQFGRYEDDSVYVRNDRLKTDFEILRDYKSYSELNLKGDE